jgi:hypothetical protein
MKSLKMTFALATAVLGIASFVNPASAKDNQGQAGGAAGLVAAVVQVAANDVADVVVTDTLNNLQAVKNVLNNSPILSSNDIDVTVGDISLLNGLDVDVNALGINVDDITGVVLVLHDGITDVLILT